MFSPHFTTDFQCSTDFPRLRFSLDSEWIQHRIDFMHPGNYSLDSAAKPFVRDRSAQRRCSRTLKVLPQPRSQRHAPNNRRHPGPIIITLADRDSVMEGLDDYCNQTVSMGPSLSSAAATAAAAAAAASEAAPSTPGVRAEKSLMFDRFPAVLGLHLNR